MLCTCVYLQLSHVFEKSWGDVYVEMEMLENDFKALQNKNDLL